MILVLPYYIVIHLEIVVTYLEYKCAYFTETTVFFLVEVSHRITKVT